MNFLRLSKKNGQPNIRTTAVARSALHFLYDLINHAPFKRICYSQTIIAKQRCRSYKGRSSFDSLRIAVDKLCFIISIISIAAYGVCLIQFNKTIIPKHISFDLHFQDRSNYKACIVQVNRNDFF
jgi:hypothetical protein